MVKRSSKEDVATVHVRLKEGVLDPQGLTIKRALEDMGYEGIGEVKSGKFFEIRLRSKNRKESEERIEEICRKLLTNPVIERYTFEFEK